MFIPHLNMGSHSDKSTHGDSNTGTANINIKSRPYNEIDKRVMSSIYLLQARRLTPDCQSFSAVTRAETHFAFDCRLKPTRPERAEHTAASQHRPCMKRGE